MNFNELIVLLQIQRPSFQTVVNAFASWTRTRMVMSAGRLEFLLSASLQAVLHCLEVPLQSPAFSSFPLTHATERAIHRESLLLPAVSLPDTIGQARLGKKTLDLSRQLTTHTNSTLSNKIPSPQSLTLWFSCSVIEEVSGSTSLHGFRVAPPKALNESCASYVIHGEEGLGDISKNAESILKVLIPLLPNESNGCRAPISSCYWEWKPKLNVYYEKSGCENINAPPVLLLLGFGVGSFHYKKQLEDLGLDFRVWAMDFFDQGMSLPMEDPAPLPMEEDLSEG
ncbi:hypothetical protein Nepgr_026241 [Nepenthes gracilis]|uniref:Uncharacterized protein n=1 Tax=Nepenthes gracilis TaxID=150966 RepID=A0AAD3T7R8_NEPGR|nr:hypothetical protein Nepgr_026241 [Nepenthes gracilis]